MDFDTLKNELIEKIVNSNDEQLVLEMLYLIENAGSDRKHYTAREDTATEVNESDNEPIETERLSSGKLELISRITALDNSRVLKSLKELMSRYPDSEQRVELSDEEKKAVEEGLADIKAGRVTTHDEVRKLYEKRL